MVVDPRCSRSRRSGPGGGLRCPPAPDRKAGSLDPTVPVPDLTLRGQSRPRSPVLDGDTERPARSLRSGAVGGSLPRGGMDPGLGDPRAPARDGHGGHAPRPRGVPAAEPDPVAGGPGSRSERMGGESRGAEGQAGRGPMTAPTRPVIRYYEGKWRLAPWIIRQFPPHRIYVEPYGGEPPSCSGSPARTARSTTTWTRRW